MFNLSVNIIMTILAFTGMMCIAHKNKLGFILFFGVECSMIYLGCISGQYGFISSALIYLGANIYSYIQWSKQK